MLGLLAKRFGLKPGSQAREAEVASPKVFSFIENPEETLTTMRGVVRAALTRDTRSISIDQEACSLIDHGAESVLSAIGLESRAMMGVRFKGSFPKSEKERDIVLATGLPKALGVPLPEPPDFLTFPLYKGRGSRAQAAESGMSERAATRLADYVDQCLASYGFELTRSGALYLTSLVGEVLGNAEDHSGQRNAWLSGYLRQPPDQPHGDCHISIFNFGRTIAESLDDLPAESLLRRSISDLTERHQRGTFFRSRRWEPENLMTVFALQDGVSRYNTGKDSLGDDRGRGTADLISFFQRLGQAADPSVKPIMCLVSGRTQILFDGTYEMREMPFEAGPARVIAFNDENDIYRPPDPRVVRCLKKPFPGTLISLRFYLDSAHLERMESSEEA